MDQQRVLKARVDEVKEGIKEVWLDLLTLAPHLSPEDRESITQALEQCKKVLQGVPSL
jgi:hypothetical protein